MRTQECPHSAAPGVSGSRSWYWLPTILIGLSLLGAGLALIIWIGTDSLTEAAREADQLDPGWRMEELESRRKVLPAAENSAQVVSAVARLLNQGEPPFWELPAEDSRAWIGRLSKLATLKPLSAVDVVALRDELKRLGPAVNAARTLAELPHGRHPIPPNPNLDALDLAHLEQVMRVVRLLCYDALSRAEKRDLGGALTSVRAALNAARSIGDEPWYWSMHIRMEARWPALHVLHRVLALGVPPAEELARVQALLEDEEKQPLALIAARGRRAYEDWNWGAAWRNVLAAPTGSTFGDWLDARRQDRDVRARRAAVLRFYNQVVEGAKLPAEEQRGLLTDLQAALNNLPVQLGWSSVHRIAEEFHVALAELRCAIVLVALERYRQDHGWPRDPSELVPAYLSVFPSDPFNGKALRVRRTADGVVVSSVGPDNRNGQDAFLHNPGRVFQLPDGTDLGWMLWEVDHRRR